MPFSACHFVLPVLSRVRRISTRYNRVSALFAGLALAAAFTGYPLRAQAPDRITAAIDPAHTQVLAGHRPAWALHENDAGAVSANLQIEQLTLVLARSPEQEAAFEQLLKDQQDPASPDYHHWLTPAEVGQRFGLSDNDLATLKAWLASQGLHVNWVSSSRVFVGFGGTASNVGHAFQTELHNYKVNGELRMAPASDPVIPQAIAPAIKAVHGLYTIENKPLSHAQTVPSNGPLMSLGTGGTTHLIAPGDFAVIYDLPSAWTGSGETIGIVGESRTDFADFTNFRTLTGSAFPNPTEVVPTAYGGVDPGAAYTTKQSSSVSIDTQGEATLDVLRAGSVAPGANLLLVVATAASGGIADDVQYLVDTNPVPAQVINISFGACELAANASAVQFWDQLFKTATGEGISVFVSSGDSGASGCDTHGSAPPASPQLNSPNYICASSYATCVGGTEFVDTSNPSQYWNSTNGTGYTSALSYIPEGAWNEPNGATSGTYVVAASGGGVSSYITTPAWQTGTGVPAARLGRYTPDISFSAAGHDGYFGCFIAGGADCSSYVEIWGGTSAAAPDMAGITAMLDQKEGSAQGNLNPAIYSMAANFPLAFHDVTVATSGVGTCAVSTPSLCNNSIAGPTSLTGGQAGYAVGTGYDEVTGWGSLDVSTFLKDYGTANLITPTVTVTTQATTFTTAQAVPVTITVSGGTGNPVPTGTYSLTATGISTQSSTLTNGTATVNFAAGSLAAGTYTFAATYSPDSNSSSVYNSASGTDATAITVTAAVQAPSATTGAATSVTASSATLNGSVNPNSADTHVYFLYGTSSSLSGATQTASQDIGTGSASVAVSATLAGLSANTTYYFQQVATNSAGTTNGSIVSFTTSAPAVQAPSATTRAATSVTASSATLNGSVNPNYADTHVYFLYGTSSSLSGATQTASQDIGSGSSNVSVTAALTGLSASTTYYFQQVATNSAGTTNGSILSFTTSAPPPAPSFAITGTAVSVSAGATTGNSSTITVAPSNGFTGTVTLSATATGPTGAANPPTFTWSNAQVAITGTGSQTATLTIATTAPTSVPCTADSRTRPAFPWSGGAAALACLILFGIPARRRRWQTLLGAALLCVFLTLTAMGCGGGSSTHSCPALSQGGTTAGSYTVTITGASGSTTETGTVTLTVN